MNNDNKLINLTTMKYKIMFTSGKSIDVIKEIGEILYKIFTTKGTTDQFQCFSDEKGNPILILNMQEVNAIVPNE